jgi:XTP/dITP diphosphohydrolase
MFSRRSLKEDVMRDLVIATRNPNKLKELKEILGDIDFNILSLDDLSCIPSVVEDGDTFEENALKKARAVARTVNRLSLADDSGLVVESLGGGPGVRSQRFAGEGAGDRENIRKLLDALKDKPFDQRKAKFVCVVGVVFPDGREEVFRGECKGYITFSPKGKMGFGYDPVFFYPELNRTFAELSPDEKNKVSHRRRALEAVKRFLKGLK